MIVIIDNYDSFTFNLVQYVGEFGYSVETIRSNQSCLSKLESLRPSHIIISPGPGCPQEAGASLQIISHFAHRIPILGVCLGHQSMGYIYGGAIKQLKTPMHGKISKIHHDQQGIFKDVPSPFKAVRYHSLVIDRSSMPEILKVTAETEDGLIMACQHTRYPNVQGVQFHPESLWTEYGRKIIKNFLTKRLQ